MIYYFTNYVSPLGKMTLVCDEKNLLGLWFEGQKYYQDKMPKEMIEKDNHHVFEIIKKWLDDYFQGKNPSIKNLPLAPIGNEFRQAVWKILCEIPYGKTITYGEIAQKIAEQRGIKTMSSQAVGGAVGHNPISVIIPCHRVIGKNGSLTGYAGGIEIKKALLELEQKKTSD